MPDKKILIVDDNKDILELLDKILSVDGYQVMQASGGQEAAEKIKKDTPHLIIMDIMLPDMYGSDVVLLINEDPATKDLPIIFISGLAADIDEGIIKSGIKVGERYYKTIAKPFDSKEIIGEVRNALMLNT